MKLFKWNTADLKPKFSNVIEKFFGKNIKDEARAEEEISTVPSVNIADVDKAFEVSIVAPGLSKDDINVEIDNGCLVISSEKQYTKEENNKNWMRREYGYASFRRMFQLPDNADDNMVDAKMKDGILTVKIAKNKSLDDKIKKIEIS